MAFKNKGVAFIVGAVAGTVVGSVTALLLAPKSGKELRGDIKAGTAKVVEAGSEAIDHVSETVYEVSKKVEDRAVKLVENTKQGVQQAVAYVKGGKTNEINTEDVVANEASTTEAETDNNELNETAAEVHAETQTTDVKEAELEATTASEQSDEPKQKLAVVQ
ncbi:YtxH domain-containing protein [Paenibacillus camelliae]|uniref:YtxH domain-containing protein n=1 Tax=Paenibacillus camelliae TaxID=512410 RepID=UPI00203EE538|nr:YtxH domain-containing protein [Paenibacillus camelliae]MCM3635416.1 YtxH domain-containing protein [Paenibacillus camelliae]